MSILSEILDHNETFVRRKEYERFLTDQFPNKKLVILTCMDTRLIELLPRAMGVRNGDVKMIKNAGAIVSHPFGSVMRSILVAVYELGAAEVAVVGHHNCGMTGLSCARVLEKVRQRVADPNVIDTLGHAGIDLQRWLVGFDHVEDGVRKSVEVIRHHPLVPTDIPVHGMIIHPETGKLDLLVDGYHAPAEVAACDAPK
jgi:carbonic anhydrase